jgi:transcriptional regulator with XRE-family HTH domain
MRIGTSVAERLRGFLDALIDRLPICDSRGLDRAQRLSLLRGFRGDLADQVDDAEHRGISEKGAARLTVTRSMIRWLERGELPGPDAVPLLEGNLASITRNTDERELAEREALVAAIHDLGGDDRAAAGIWREPAREHPDALAAYGRALHGLMLAAGLTVAELADRAGLEPSTVVAYVCGTEEARFVEALWLLDALDVPPDEFAGRVDGELDRSPAGSLRDGGLNPRRSREASP